MAFTAKDTEGFEIKYNKAGFPTNPVEYELTPNTDFSKGQLVTIPMGNAGAGTLTPLTSTITVNGINTIVGVMAESFTAATNPTGAKTFGKVYDNPFNVYRVSFADHLDGTAAAASTAADYLQTGVVSTAANVLKGATVHIYEGPGEGDTRTITANRATDGRVTVAPAFSSTPTTATKYIILASKTTDGFTAAGYNVGTIGGKLSTGSVLKMSAKTAAAVATGYLNVLAINPEKLTADVMITPAKHMLTCGRTS